MIEVTKYRHKNIGVYGLGRTGKASIYALTSGGANVIAWDDSEEKREIWLKNNDPIHLIHNPENILVEFDHPKWRKIEKLIITPGIQIYGTKAHKIIDLARDINCHIISDIELLWETCKNAKYIGITGTNGKSTTTSLIGHILKSNNIRSQTGGNIGTAALELEPFNDDGIYVLELSSYQLDIVSKLSLNISVLLNITEDHIEYHGNVENYINSKLQIFKNQTKDNLAIISIDDEINQNIYRKIDKYTKARIIPISTKQKIPGGVSVINKKVFDLTSNNIESYDIDNIIHLPGEHNSENIAAAYAVAINFIHSKDKIIDSINKFVGLPHRLEYIASKCNITFINDSKATNADSTEKALECFDNIYWILGGVAKHDGINKLEKYFHKIRYAFLIGESQDEFANIIHNKISYSKCNNLYKAFISATKLAKKTDEKIVILFSPACSSFDQYKNFEDRGEEFRRIVQEFMSKDI